MRPPYFKALRKMNLTVVEQTLDFNKFVVFCPYKLPLKCYSGERDSLMTIKRELLQSQTTQIEILIIVFNKIS
jgi:hypothetical protein